MACRHDGGRWAWRQMGLATIRPHAESSGLSRSVTRPPRLFSPLLSCHMAAPDTSYPAGIQMLHGRLLQPPHLLVISTLCPLRLLLAADGGRGGCRPSSPSSWGAAAAAEAVRVRGMGPGAGASRRKQGLGRRRRSGGSGGARDRTGTAL